MGLLGATAFWSLYVEGGSRVSINVLNFAVLFLALLLHPSPASFTRAATRGATYLHGIVIQFPFYAGMYGLDQVLGAGGDHRALVHVDRDHRRRSRS